MDGLTDRGREGERGGGGGGGEGMCGEEKGEEDREKVGPVKVLLP